MPTTTNGVPYPAGTSALSTWAATMLALAQWIDDRLNTICKVYQGTTATTLTTAVAAVLPMDAEEADPKAMHSTSVNTSRITVATAGRYHLQGQVAFAANAVGYRTATILKNGVQVGQSRVMAPPTLPGVVQVDATVTASAADYFELQASQSSGGNLATVVGAGNTYLFARLLGDD